MKARVFYDKNSGCGGPNGYVELTKYFCFEHADTRYHATHYFCSTGRPEDRVDEFRDIRPCDGSCQREKELSEEQEKKLLDALSKAAL